MSKVGKSRLKAGASRESGKGGEGEAAEPRTDVETIPVLFLQPCVDLLIFLPLLRIPSIHADYSKWTMNGELSISLFRRAPMMELRMS